MSDHAHPTKTKSLDEGPSPTEKEFLAHLAKVAPKLQRRAVPCRPVPLEATRRSWLTSIGHWLIAGIGAAICGFFVKLFKNQPGKPKLNLAPVFHNQLRRWREDQKRQEQEQQDQLLRGLLPPNHQ